jgi:hypothetical protein
VFVASLARMTTTMMPQTRMCRDCVLVGQMLFCNSGGNSSAMSDRHPNKRVNLDGLDDQAGNGGPKMRSTKVPTKSNSASQSRPSTRTSQAGTMFPLQAETRS